MRKPFVSFLTLTVLLLTLAACGRGGGGASTQTKGQYPGTEEGLRKLMGEIVADGANAAKQSQKLRPTAEDYAVVFEGDFAKEAEKTYEELWKKGQLVLRTKPGQTEMKLVSVTSEDLKTKTPKSLEFPGGWLKTAPHLKPGLTVYLVRFAEPGKEHGLRIDGLIYVNGRWRIFPKPWRVRQP